MPGLMARILSRRADGAPLPVPPAEDAAPADPPESGAVVGGEAPPSLPADASAPDGTEVTCVLPAVPAAPVPGAPAAEPAEPGDAALPAAAEPEPAGARPSFRSRGPLRRRLRYLRRVRELGFRDLGGLVFDLDRFGRDRTDLVRAKLDALRAIDAEARALETALADRRSVEELHEPGISACLHCGSLHGSEARFCPACGTPVGSPSAPIELPAAAPRAHDPAEPAGPETAAPPDAEPVGPEAAAPPDAEPATEPVPGAPSA